MAHGVFRLFVKSSEHRPWGLLETFPFDDAQKRKHFHRQNTLSRVKHSLMHWAYNYAQYRDAPFCIEEKQDEFSPSLHVFGTPRTRADKRKGGLKRKPYERKPT